MEIPGHTMKLEQRSHWVPAYGNSETQSNRPYFVCSCGEELQLDSYPPLSAGRNFELARLGHEVAILIETVFGEKENNDRRRH